MKRDKIFRLTDLHHYIYESLFLFTAMGPVWTMKAITKSCKKSGYFFEYRTSKTNSSALSVRCNKKPCESCLNIKFGGALINEKVPEKTTQCAKIQQLRNYKRSHYERLHYVHSHVWHGLITWGTYVIMSIRYPLKCSMKSLLYYVCTPVYFIC